MARRKPDTPTFRDGDAHNRHSIKGASMRDLARRRNRRKSNAINRMVVQNWEILTSPVPPSTMTS